jgi:hypothetical protein
VVQGDTSDQWRDEGSVIIQSWTDRYFQGSKACSCAMYMMVCVLAVRRGVKPYVEAVSPPITGVIREALHKVM